MIRSPAVLGADGNLTFRTFQTFPYTAHIHGQKLCHLFRYGSAAAVSNFLKYGNVLVDPAVRSNIFIF